MILTYPYLIYVYLLSLNIINFTRFAYYICVDVFNINSFIEIFHSPFCVFNNGKHIKRKMLARNK